jgi:DNA-binding NarL/FixJ family response regulator
MATKNGSGVVRVLAVAGASVRRAGLEAIVRESRGFRLVAAVASTSSLAAQLRGFQPDVILADLERSDASFVAALSSVADALVPAVVLIDEPAVAWTVRAVRAGVKAILPRDSASGDIVSAIKAAHGGLVTLAPDVMDELTRYVHPEESELAVEVEEGLTPREVEVIRMLGSGLTNKEMARRLGISDHTVKFHISSIFAKLGVSSRTEAVTQGIRRGLVVV